MGAESNVILVKSFEFSKRIYFFAKKLRELKEYELSSQIFRSGTSIGANAEEAVGGMSKRDFIAKLSISYKESREVIYWLRLCSEVDLLRDDAEELKAQATELTKILTSILKSSKANS